MTVLRRLTRYIVTALLILAVYGVDDSRNQDSEEKNRLRERNLQNAPSFCPVFNPLCLTPVPTKGPTSSPIRSPTGSPTKTPTLRPSLTPTSSPSAAPTLTPSSLPTNSPTLSPSSKPTASPSQNPSVSPTSTPSSEPTSSPTQNPSASPSTTPTSIPSTSPTFAPTTSPSTSPTKKPTISPTNNPTSSPLNNPTNSPSFGPTVSPTLNPTLQPTDLPTASPTTAPTDFVLNSTSPTSQPTISPTGSNSPSNEPTRSPLNIPTESPTLSPVEIAAEQNCLNLGVCKVSSQRCSSDGECSSNSCSDLIGLCEPSDRSRMTYIAMISLIGFSTFTSVSCCCCACWKHKKAKKALLARKIRSKGFGAGAAQTGVQINMKNQCEKLVSDNIKMKQDFRLQFHNVSSIRVKSELDKAIWMHSIISLCAMFYTFNDRSSKNAMKMSARNCNHFLSDLNQVSQRLWYALDMSHSKQSRESEAEKAKQEMMLAAKLLPDIITSSKSISISLIPQQMLGKHNPKDASWGWKSQNYKRLFKICQSMKPTFLKFNDESLEQRLVKNDNSCAKYIHKTHLRFRSNLYLYAAFFLSLCAIFLSFALRINSSRETFSKRTLFGLPPQYTLFKSGDSDDDDLLSDASRRLQENDDLQENNEQSLQRIFIPIVYGFMHCAIFCLALLPLPVCRGLWREVSLRYPQIVKLVPINDFDRMHIQLGIYTLSFLLCGGITWIVVMTIDCMNEVQDACIAFDPILKSLNSDGRVDTKLWVSPIDNVIALRIIVLILWFPLLPLLYWAKHASELSFLSKIRPLRQIWYEFCYYTHVVVALASVVLALVCRFQIFFVILPPWILYVFDRFLDRTMYTHKMTLTERTVFSRESLRTIPNSMRLKLSPASRRHLRVSAGQWIYLQVPKIDYTWHPFSLASASSERDLELHVGVISYPGDWVETFDSKTRTKQTKNKHPTWTARLFQLVNTPNPQLTTKVMGPYGWAFSSCFNSKKYAGSVVIGAGTGLTAAESVLREYIFLKKQEMAVEQSKKSTTAPIMLSSTNQPRLQMKTSSHSQSSNGSLSKVTMVPEKVWFIWSCKEVDDLLWCWNNLVRLIVDICQQGIVDINTLVVPESSMLDWLGVTIFVTRARSDVMKEFRASFKLEGDDPFSLTAQEQSETVRGKLAATEPEKEMNPEALEDLQPGDSDKNYTVPGFVSDRELSLSELEQKVKSWLYSRIIEGGLGDRDTHIARFLNGCRNVLNDTSQRDKDLSVCYCGPSALSVTIQEAVDICPGNTKIEFSADHM